MGTQLGPGPVDDQSVSNVPGTRAVQYCDMWVGS